MPWVVWRIFGLAYGTCFDAWDWANRQAHTHASTGGHVDQCIKAEFTNLAPAHLIQSGLGQPQGFGCCGLGQSAGLKPFGDHSFLLPLVCQLAVAVAGQIKIGFAGFLGLLLKGMDLG